MAEQEKPQQPQIKPDDEEFTSDYANNVYFVPSLWDLKLLFGELSATNKEVDWHTSITVPWAQAKLMAYFLNVNIAAHEANNGRIRIPEALLPPEPPPVRQEDKNNENIKALLNYIRETRNKLIAESK